MSAPRRTTPLLATFRAALAEAWANRAGFWGQIAAMVVNDLAWVAFWLLFFHRVGEVRGWDAGGVLMLQAVLTTAGGLALGVTANARSIGRLAAAGELDAALALPVPPLAHLLARRVEPVYLGDLAFGVGLFLAAGRPTVERAGVYAAGAVAGAVLLAGFLVATGSLSFFAGRNDIGELSFHSVLLFASYPVDVFAGAGRVLLHTVLPAAFVAAVPARLVEEFDPGAAAAVLAASATFAGLGWAVFTLGLRRYTSGALWTRT
jgi:ABC-2 type transport system permease protein